MASGGYRPVGTLVATNYYTGGRVTETGDPSQDFFSLTATANAGYEFSEWSWTYGGSYDLSSVLTEDGSTLSVDNSHKDDCYGSGRLTVKAVFVKTETPPEEDFYYNITTDVAKGNGTTSGDGRYKEGDPHTVTAIPNERYEFVKWKCSDGTTITSSTVTRPTTNDLTYHAYFTPKSTGEILFSPSFGGSIIHNGSPMCL